MQNSKTTVKLFEVKKAKIFIAKLKTAYMFLKSPKSFIVIGKEIRSFNVTSEEVGQQCEQIHYGLVTAEIEKEEQRIDQAIHQLVYLN
jgi:hypothetical protein